MTAAAAPGPQDPGTGRASRRSPGRADAGAGQQAPAGDARRARRLGWRSPPSAVADRGELGAAGDGRRGRRAAAPQVVGGRRPSSAAYASSSPSRSALSAVSRSKSGCEVGSAMVDALDVGGGVAVPERGGERGPAARDAGPHGADRDVERRGDLRVVEVGDVTRARPRRGTPRAAPRARPRGRAGRRHARGRSPRGAGGSWRARWSDAGTARRRRAPRSSSSAAFTAMRCDQVVNAARPSKRAIERVIAMSACWVASNAASGPQIRRQIAWRRSTWRVEQGVERVAVAGRRRPGRARRRARGQAGVPRTETSAMRAR